VLSGVRYFLSDVAHWVRSHPVRGLLALLAGAAVVAGAILLVGELTADDDGPPAPAPDVIVGTGEPAEEPTDLGFPAFATSNTTRVAGADATAVAAGVALATHPAAGAVEGPDAVTLVPADDWAAGVAAAALVSDPVAAPILLTDGEELPELSESALASLDPQGSAATQERQVFAVGEAPEPEGMRTQRIEGAGAAGIAAEIALVRERLIGREPAHLLVAPADDPEFAMPAAAWAARSGDPVLFAQRESVSDATLEVLERYDGVPVYILGGTDVISQRAEEQLADATRAPVRRAAEEDDPVANAIAFARYVDGSFGWDINDPGHGFVLANLTRPADAGAAAALSGTGTWGPLLLTDDAAAPPADLEAYMLDLKPGYTDDPTRAVYNHVWIIGDESAISVDLQVEIDEIAEVAPVRSGSGEDFLGPAPGTPEPEGQDRTGNSNDADGNP